MKGGEKHFYLEEISKQIGGRKGRMGAEPHQKVTFFSRGISLGGKEVTDLSLRGGSKRHAGSGMLVRNSRLYHSGPNLRNHELDTQVSHAEKKILSLEKEGAKDLTVRITSQKNEDCETQRTGSCSFINVSGSREKGRVARRKRRQFAE